MQFSKIFAESNLLFNLTSITYMLLKPLEVTENQIVTFK